jgi:condensin complex subunit 2
VLECLNRNGNTCNDDDDDDNINETATKRGNAKVGSKNTSSRLNIAETIEKNVENINAPVLDTANFTDPLFHKMSKAFDEGGAKGMLMYNMVSYSIDG